MLKSVVPNRIVSLLKRVCLSFNYLISFIAAACSSLLQHGHVNILIIIDNHSDVVLVSRRLKDKNIVSLGLDKMPQEFQEFLLLITVKY